MVPMNRFFICIILLSNIASAQVDLTLGLRAYYPFSGNANDASGNNNNPVFNNATLTTDRNGIANSAYLFNGIDNYIRIPNSASLNQSNTISISAWVKVNGFYQGTCHGNNILMKGDDDVVSGKYLLRFDDNAYTNGQNCINPIVDSLHQNFYGVNSINPPGGYTPNIQKNQWHNVVYTYDGNTAKLYVDCELKISTPVNNLTFTNSYDLYFGKMVNPNYQYWFYGVLDEVRIYNRPLNQEEVNVLGGCNSSETIINTYTPVLAFNPCENKITVEDASTFNVGDTVMLIQMKGAIIDSTNTAAFGTITDYKNAGNYEFNYVKSKTGNIIELQNTITRQYNITDGKVQLIRVPYYQNVNITSTLTCLPWDGSKGGVLVLNVRDTINMTNKIDVSGKGFIGGIGYNSENATLNCFQNDFNYPQSSNAIAGQKGESIVTLSSNINFGKGNATSGGGGGLGHNSGGGGGSNGGAGGFGGYQLDACGGSPFDNRGIGGIAMNYSSNLNRVFLGGGGGAGQADNPGNIPPAGGNGGGIIILLSNFLKTNNNKIIANGNNAIECSIPASTDCHDGMGGGGAAGSILLSVNQILDNLSVENKGGNGANMVGSVSLGGRIGGGGGGAGGLLFIKNSSMPAVINNNNSGGFNGVLTQDASNVWGSTLGQNGTAIFNLVIPIDNTPFKPNIDSLKIKDSLLSCSNFDFKGFGFTNTNPISTWQWYFGDGGTASTQNTTHTYAQGNYAVKLIITDINGCKDSLTKNIFASTLTIDAGPSDTICAPGSSLLQASSIGAIQYDWAPAAFLNDPTILNPTATPPVTTMFYLTATNASGCSSVDSVLINVRSLNSFSIDAVAPICLNKSVQLNADGGDLYSWQPASSLNNPGIFNPTASPTITTIYSVLVTDTICGNASTLSTTVTVLPLPAVTAGKSNDIDCSTAQSQLNANGAMRYSWSPAASLNNSSIGNPIAAPTVTTQYIVTGTNAAGCVNYDNITVKVSADNKSGYLMPTAFTPNNDGKNDCYRIKYWGTILELEFSIYNRWGERVFFTKNPNDCWDGRYKGELQNSAVFIYMIKAKTTCANEVFRKGTFALIR